MMRFNPPRLRAARSLVGAVALSLGTFAAYAQTAAPSYADMRTWQLQGVSGGNWVDPRKITQPFTSATSGRSVFQTVNNTAGTMFLVSNDTNVINRAVWGTLRIESRHTDADGACAPGCSSFETDDDWLGFVVGYRNITGSPQFPEQYLGFTWNRGGTSPYTLTANSSNRGIFLVRAAPPNTAGDPIGAGVTIIDSDTGASKGWAYDTDYQFRILYTTDQIRVYINDELRLEATAAQAGVSSFSAGQFGFTNASQANVLFGNVREADASAIDTAPVASDDKFYYGITWGAPRNEPNTFDTNTDALADGILDNDYDPDGDLFTLRVNGTLLPNDGDSTSITGTQGGTFLVYGSGRVVYTAPADYQTRGPFQDTFPYTIVDEDGEHTAVVTVTVQETNTTPDDIRLTDADAGSITDIRVNQGSAPGTAVGTIAVIENNTGELDQYDYDLSNASGGAFSIVGDQLVVRDTTALGGPQTHTIVIRATDVEGQSITRTFSVIVDPNALPASANSSVTAAATIPLAFSLTDFPFTDSDGDTLQKVQIASLPAHGTLFLDLDADNIADLSEVLQINFNDIATRTQIAAGVLKYLSNSATNTSASFTFKVNDGTAYAAGVSTMTVTVTTDIDSDGIPNSVEGTTDTDGDSTPDYRDTDSDNDGIPDVTEGVGDSDGDSIPNYRDTDSDGDGIPDATEGAGDSDGDGTPDYRDTDSDGDGIPDATEGAGDSDNDGIPDYRDTDSDNDGIPDAAEGAGDSDGDGIPDYRDNDSDNDGISDTTEGDDDLDQDGTPDYQDSDRDGDGVPDNVEITQGTNPSDVGDAQDTDDDGVPDYVEQTNGTSPTDSAGFRDTDGDGVPDYVELQDGTNPNNGTDFADADADGHPDYTDRDSDNDGVPDVVEGTGDPDGDGTPDYLDRDSDNDGIPDAFESGAYGIDSDDDGVDDRWDASAPNATDANGDGVADGIGLADTDGDGIADQYDLDSDNDGISDAVESGATGTDSDHDGIDDAFDVDTAGGADANHDHITDGAQALDTDGDGVPDFRDLDSDNDSLYDVIESGALDDDDDGLLDVGGTVTATPRDTDGDGRPDHRDVDSNGDGVMDIRGTRFTALDVNGDGRIDTFGLDADGDGIADAIDGEPGQHGTRIDNDEDGVPASLDLDDDGDGIPDTLEGDGDADGDGVIDRLDRDADGDGVPDRVEMGLLRPSGTDSNGNGIDDAYEGLGSNRRDTDSDGLPDYLDTDSDNDGLADVYEILRVRLSGSDADGDGIDDALDADATGGVDADGDGIDDAAITLADTDGDGLPDYRDADSDNDGVADGSEDGDFNRDGVNDRLQKDPGLNTGLKGGAGSVGGFMLICGLGLLGMRRLRGNTLRTTAMLGCVLAIGSMQIESAHADDTMPGCRTGSSFSEGCWSMTIGYFATELQPDDSRSVWRVADDRDTGYKISAEYRFHERWLVELGYADLGSADLVSRNPAITERSAIDYSALSLFGGYLLLDPTQRFNAHVKVGYAMLTTEADHGAERHQNNNSQLAVGAGLRARVWQQLNLQLEYEYYDKDARQLGLQMRYSF